MALLMNTVYKFNKTLEKTENKNLNVYNKNQTWISESQNILNLSF